MAGTHEGDAPLCWRHSDEVAEACAQVLKGHRLGRVLDAGGGEGFVTSYLMRRLPVDAALVLDRDADLLARVEAPIVTRRGLLEDLDASDGEFSTILMRQVLHYVESPEDVLSLLQERLRSDGALYIGQIVAPDAASAHWLGSTAGWISASRHRVWTADSLLATLLRAGLRLERASLLPVWQALDDRVLGAGVDNGAPRLISLRERVGRVWCRLPFLHAALRPENPH